MAAAAAGVVVMGTIDVSAIFVSLPRLWRTGLPWRDLAVCLPADFNASCLLRSVFVLVLALLSIFVAAGPAGFVIATIRVPRGDRARTFLVAVLIFRPVTGSYVGSFTARLLRARRTRGLVLVLVVLLVLVVELGLVVVLVLVLVLVTLSIGRAGEFNVRVVVLLTSVELSSLLL